MNSDAPNFPEPSGHWKQAARHWRYSGPPLRPHPADIELYRAAVEAWFARAGRAPDALLLGVTPELFNLPWPDGTKLLAVDQSPDMIDAVWPGPPDQVRLGEWLQLPAADGSRDLVLCDGGLAMLAYPHQQASLAAELRRVVRDGGRCVLRLFAPPEKRETVEAVMNSLRHGSVPDLNALKFRLWMALHRSAAEGIRPHKVWQLIHAAADGDLAGLAARFGWPEPHVLALEAHRNSEARYYLSGVREVRDIFCKGDAGFDLESVRFPAHPFGAACPSVVLARHGLAREKRQ